MLIWFGSVNKHGRNQGSQYGCIFRTCPKICKKDRPWKLLAGHHILVIIKILLYLACTWYVPNKDKRCLFIICISSIIVSIQKNSETIKSLKTFSRSMFGVTKIPKLMLNEVVKTELGNWHVNYHCFMAYYFLNPLISPLKYHR